MESFQIYRSLSELNSLPEGEAEDIFRSISGSDVWAREMARQRPFHLLESLFAAADSLWFSLPPVEWTSAFEKCRRELSAIDDNSYSSKDLEEAMGLYMEKFGFIFVLDTRGKDPAEITAVCLARLGNSAKTELQIAAEEHRKTIERRLSTLLEK